MRKLSLAISLAVAPACAAYAHHHEGTEAMAKDGVIAEEAAVQAAIEGIYDVISGQVGAPRDWDRMRSLMTEDARLTPIGPNGHRSHDIDGYIERSEPFLLEQGFFEIETGNRIEIFGNLAQVWSAYEGRTGSADGPVFVTGINSFQLVKTEDGWKVFSILWQAANDELPVPADLAAKEAN
ncbi:YybH family protein [Altererythrobacter ishigakiensis]|nr:nuclear transport factor 2 family protein [Altererythrobacter ishigakiensis]